MIFRNPQQRVAVLVDVQNLYYSARNLYSANVNYKKLLEMALSDRILTRAIAYAIKSDTVEGEVSFFDAINNAGFEVKEKTVQVFQGGAKKGDWDIGIAMDAIRLGHKVDSIVLVSGDGDFVPVVNYLQQSLGCLVEVVAFGKTTNNTLKEIADDYIDLEDHKADILMRSSRSRGNPTTRRKGPAPKINDKSQMLDIQKKPETPAKK